MLRNVLLLVLLSASSSAFANTQAAPDKRVPFEQQRKQVEADLRGGDVYKEISGEDRNKVLELLARMQVTLGSEAAPEALPEQHKIDFFNDQEQVNALLDKARADSRLVCERHRAVGSKLPQNICLTVAERRRMRDDASDTMRSIKRSEDPQK